MAHVNPVPIAVDNTPLVVNGIAHSLEDLLGGPADETIEPLPTRGSAQQHEEPVRPLPNRSDHAEERPRTTSTRSEFVGEPVRRPRNNDAPLPPEIVPLPGTPYIMEGDAIIIVERNPNRVRGMPDFQAMNDIQRRQAKRTITQKYEELCTNNPRLRLPPIEDSMSIEDRWILYSEGRDAMKRQSGVSFTRMVVRVSYYGIAAAQYFMFKVNPMPMIKHCDRVMESIEPLVSDTGELSLIDNIQSMGSMTQVMIILAVNSMIFLVAGLFDKGTWAPILADVAGGIVSGQDEQLNTVISMVGGFFPGAQADQPRRERRRRENAPAAADQPAAPATRRARNNAPPATAPANAQQALAATQSQQARREERREGRRRDQLYTE